MENYKELKGILNSIEHLNEKSDIKEKLVAGIDENIFCEINNQLKDNKKSNEFKSELFAKGLIDFVKVNDFRDMKCYCEDIWDDFGKYNFRHRFKGFVSRTFVLYEDDWVFLGNNERNLFLNLEEYLYGMHSGIRMDEGETHYNISRDKSFAHNVYPYPIGTVNGLYIFIYIESDHYQYKFNVDKFDNLNFKIFVCEKF